MVFIYKIPHFVHESPCVWCACVCMYLAAHEHMLVEVRGQSSVLSSETLSISFETGFLLSLELTN